MFVDWYHRWWFIALTALVHPLISIVLLITSPHKKAHKIIAVIIAILFSVLYTFASGFIFNLFFPPEEHVNTSLTKEEYIAQCETVSPEEFYRNPQKYCDAFVKLELVVTETATSADHSESICFICKSPDGGDFVIFVNSYLIENEQNFVPGDKITVYGEGAGIGYVYDNNGHSRKSTRVNMAYVTLEGK